MSLYDLLDVSEDASQSQIRKAYRKKAMRLHPDRNPSESAEAEFKDIQKAYAVLGDPERRREYDLTGGVDETPIDQEARQVLAQLFEEVLKSANKMINITANLKGRIDSHHSGLVKVLAEAEAETKRLNGLVDRVKHTGAGADLFSGVLREKISAAEKKVSSIQNTQEVTRRVSELLEEYESFPEKQEVVNSTKSYSTSTLGGIISGSGVA